MKALFINPHKLIPRSFSLTQRSSPPLGLAYVAGAVEKQGYHVTVIDCVADAPNHYFPFNNYDDIAALGIGFDEMFEKLDSDYDLIGMSCMFSNNWLINRHVLSLLKQHYPWAVIVIGGEHASAIPEYCLNDCDGLDVVVIGEGEETISELARLLKEGKSFKNIEGIAYKIRDKEKEIISNSPRKRIKEINTIETPAWHLFPLQKYFDNDISYGIAYGRSLPILATRGCPYECTFCSSPQMWGTKYTMRDVENVINEIKYLNAVFGITNFDFYDLTAIIKKHWILDFCSTVKREKLKITWQIPAGTRSEGITYEVAIALKESGCKNITYAPETGSEKMVLAIKKETTIRSMLYSIEQSYKAGLNIKLNVLMGYPDERISDIMKTYLFLIKASYYGAADASPSIFSAYPGSDMFDELLERNEVKISDDYFIKIVFSQSLHHLNNYNRYYSKSLMTFLLLLGYLVFYGSNYIFRPVRMFRLFVNLVTHNYQTRGEYMLGEIIRRTGSIKY
jgi:anaerobic magnesium-protoporphyrin IX monomethyl ester cyclase